MNRHTAVARDDGRIVIVVSGRDPGNRYPNWLTTAGHSCGAMLLRYVEASDFPPVATRVVTQDELERGTVDV